MKSEGLKDKELMVVKRPANHLNMALRMDSGRKSLI